MSTTLYRSSMIYNLDHEETSDYIWQNFAKHQRVEYVDVPKLNPQEQENKTKRKKKKYINS